MTSPSKNSADAIPDDRFEVALACAARIAEEAITLDDGEDCPMLNHHVAASIIWSALMAERERAGQIVDDECARVLSKQDGKEEAVDRNLRFIALLLPDIAAAIRGGR